MLTKKQDFLEKKIEQELMIAKKNGTKNKRGEFRVKYCRTWRHYWPHKLVSAVVKESNVIIYNSDQKEQVIQVSHYVRSCGVYPEI